MLGGRFPHPDGSIYHGSYRQAGRRPLSQGLGTLTRPLGETVYAGQWNNGSETIGVLRFPAANLVYSGQWAHRKRNGLGMEEIFMGPEKRATFRIFKGEFTANSKGRHGVSHWPAYGTSYAGMWDDDYPEGYGIEAYKDGGSYIGQRLRGSRTGFGVRISAVFDTQLPGIFAREGFVLSSAVKSEPASRGVVEKYSGQWRDSARIGFGVCERSDGLKYEGEWKHDLRHGYGVTTRKDGSREEGKYYFGKLVARVDISLKSICHGVFRASRQKVAESVAAARRAAEIAKKKAATAVEHAEIAKERAREAEGIGRQAKYQADLAVLHARQFHVPDGA